MTTATTWRYRYVGESRRPVHVLGRLTRRADSRHKQVDDPETGDAIDVPDRIEVTDLDDALALEASPLFERLPGVPKPAAPDDETDADDGAETTTEES